MTYNQVNAGTILDQERENKVEIFKNLFIWVK
jgi:hypothetical protein